MQPPVASDGFELGRMPSLEASFGVHDLQDLDLVPLADRRYLRSAEHWTLVHAFAAGRQNTTGAPSEPEPPLAQLFWFLSEIPYRRDLRHWMTAYNGLYRFALHTKVAATPWPELPVTWFMVGAAAFHRRALIIPTPADQEAFLRWYFVETVSKAGLERFVTPAQRRALAASHRDDPARLPLAARLVWSGDPALQRRFDLRRTEDRAEFAQWFAEIGRAEFGLGFVPDHTSDVEGGQNRDLRDASGPIELTRDLHALSIHPDALIAFGSGGNAGGHCVRQTWYGPEDGMTWTRGRVGLFAFTMAPRARRRRIVIDVDIRYDAKAARTQGGELTITFNNAPLHRSPWTDQDSRRLVLPVGSEYRLGRSPNVIAFHNSRPFRPCDVDVTNDQRELGVGLERIWIRYDD